MRQHGLSTDDLHAIVVARPEDQLPREVHFTPEGSEQLARVVVAAIESGLPEQRVTAFLRLESKITSPASALSEEWLFCGEEKPCAFFM